MLLVHDTLHVLHYNDGVVHHGADGQNQTQQCHQIERKSECKHHTERTDERNGYGDDGNKRRTPALQR